MKRYILTGPPGAGKTAILRELQARGYAVVEEAATDVIAVAQAHGVDQPWSLPGFADEVVAVQRRRQEQPAAPGTTVQIYWCVSQMTLRWCKIASWLVHRLCP